MRSAACRVLGNAESKRTTKGHGDERKRPSGPAPPPALQGVPAVGDLARGSQALQRFLFTFPRNRFFEMGVELLEQPPPCGARPPELCLELSPEPIPALPHS
jgi:hypothetical protein